MHMKEEAELSLKFCIREERRIWDISITTGQAVRRTLEVVGAMVI